MRIKIYRPELAFGVEVLTWNNFASKLSTPRSLTYGEIYLDAISGCIPLLPLLPCPGILKFATD